MVRRRKHGESNCIFRQTDRQTDRRTKDYTVLYSVRNENTDFLLIICTSLSFQIQDNTEQNNCTFKPKF